jgi:very-short-patch-repair endonuclease
MPIRPVVPLALRTRLFTVAEARFLGRPDLLYPNEGLAIEYDGGNHRDRLVDDNRRQNRLVSAGLRFLRFTAVDVFSTPDSVAIQVRNALAAPHLSNVG